jgi:hypothetical protein
MKPYDGRALRILPYGPCRPATDRTGFCATLFSSSASLVRLPDTECRGWQRQAAGRGSRTLTTIPPPGVTVVSTEAMEWGSRTVRGSPHACCAKLRRLVRLGGCVRPRGADGWRRSRVDFVTAHDGVTIRDLVSYNPSWNCGVEGPTGGPDYHTA